jgi:dTDP-4-amino-4,6-dideoxygalactose transaminase
MISKSPENRDSFKRQIYFTNSAREGWSVILNSLEQSSKILLPSYIGITDREGSGIFDPIQNLNMEHSFYLLNDDLSISVIEIEKCLRESDYSLILLVHYFGFKIHNIEEIVKVCKKYNVTVVEDCAHLYNYNLFEYSDAGTFGDFTFYSLHKNFPLKNGGMVVQNNTDILQPNFSIIQLLNNCSKKLFSYDAKAIADKRRENFRILDKLVQNIKGIQPLKNLEEGDIPHSYPILVDNGLRERLYFWLIDKNITLIALYYRLIPALQIEKYANMQKLSNSILNLPIHQDIDEEELRKIVNKIIEFNGRKR